MLSTTRAGERRVLEMAPVEARKVGKVGFLRT